MKKIKVVSLNGELFFKGEDSDIYFERITTDFGTIRLFRNGKLLGKMPVSNHCSPFASYDHFIPLPCIELKQPWELMELKPVMFGESYELALEKGTYERFMRLLQIYFGYGVLDKKIKKDNKGKASKEIRAIFEKEWGYYLDGKNFYLASPKIKIVRRKDEIKYINFLFYSVSEKRPKLI